MFKYRKNIVYTNTLAFFALNTIALPTFIIILRPLYSMNCSMIHETETHACEPVAMQLNYQRERNIKISKHSNTVQLKLQRKIIWPSFRSDLPSRSEGAVSFELSCFASFLSQHHNTKIRLLACLVLR